MSILPTVLMGYGTLYLYQNKNGLFLPVTFSHLMTAYRAYAYDTHGVTMYVYEKFRYTTQNVSSRKVKGALCEDLFQGRSQAWAWGAEAPPNVILAPHANEFQPMKCSAPFIDKYYRRDGR